MGRIIHKIPNDFNPISLAPLFWNTLLTGVEKEPSNEINGLLDQSGNGNDLNAAGALRPTYQATGMDGVNPGAFFSGNNALSFAGILKPKTILIIGKKSLIANSSALISDGSAPGTLIRYANGASPTNNSSRYSNGDGTAISANFDQTAPNMISAQVFGSALRIWNGTTEGTPAPVGTGDTNIDCLDVGGYTPDNRFFLVGYIGACIGFSQVLTDAELLKVQLYFANLWNIAV